MIDLTLTDITLEDSLTDMNNILNFGTLAFINSSASGKAGSHLNPERLSRALSMLSGSREGFDFSFLRGCMTKAGMADLLQSWLDDGHNQPISSDQIFQALGETRLLKFADQLGVTIEEATGGLGEALPRMVDNASSGGQLLNSIDVAQGLLKLASHFSGR